MANTTFLLILLVIICVSTINATSLDHQFDWISRKPSFCQGSIGECESADEFDLDSEINRRILAEKKYISVGALKANTVPCSGGAYYGNCASNQANVYNQACTKITRCRG
ncbi:hypothetical protein ACHQM5_026582 [Ranunculus cassubicifolius]